MTLQTVFQTSREVCVPLLESKCACLSCREGELPTVQFQIPFIPLEKSLLFQPLSFPTQPILLPWPQNSTQELAGTSPHSSWLLLTALCFSLYCSLLAYTVRKGQLLPGRLRISLCRKTTPGLAMKRPHSASAAPASSTALATSSGAWSRGDRLYSRAHIHTMERLPCNLKSSQGKPNGLLEDYNSELEITFLLHFSGKSD